MNCDRLELGPIDHDLLVGKRAAYLNEIVLQPELCTAAWT